MQPRANTDASASEPATMVQTPSVNANTTRDDAVALALAAEQDRAHRERVNFAFRVGRGLRRVHQVVDADAREYYDDDHLFDYDDSDHDDVSTNGDDDVYQSQEGDEPYDESDQTPEEQHAQASGNAPTSTSAISNVATASTGALPAGAARDPMAARYTFVPEKRAVNNSVTTPKQPPATTNAAKPLAVGTTARNVNVAPESAVRENVDHSKPVESFKTSTQSTEAAPAGTKAIEPTPKTSHPPTKLRENPADELNQKEGEKPAVQAKAVTGSEGQKMTEIDTVAQTPKVSKPNPLAPTSAAPYGYKVVKVRKPDGTIAQVKRPLKAEEAKKLESAPRPTVNTNGNNAEAKGSTTGEKKQISVSSQATEAKIEPSIKTTPKSGGPKEVSVVKPGTVTAAKSNEPDVKVNNTSKADQTVSNVAGASGAKRNIQITEKELSNEKQDITPPSSKTDTIIRRSTKVMQFLSWTIMIVFSLIFLGLSITALALNHRQPQTGAFIQFKTVAISLWPIVFAAILAQTFKAYAAYQIERGIALVTVEQLISSNSVGGAIKQPFLLRTFNLTTIALLFMWSLSPLAGQALVRMINTSAADVVRTNTISYFAPQSLPANETDLAYFGPAYYPDSTQIEAMYTSSLLGSRTARQNMQDGWSNIKIPSTSYDMSSLIGVPFVIPTIEYKDNEDRSGETWEFNIQSSFFRFNCTDIVRSNLGSPEMRRLNMTVGKSHTLYLSAENNTNLAFLEGENDTLVSYRAPGPTGTIHFASLDVNHEDVKANNATIRDASTYGYYSKCLYEQVLINSTVGCGGSGLSAICKVTHAEPITIPEKEKTPLGYYFADVMRNAACQNDSGSATETEKYIVNRDFASTVEHAGNANGLDGGTYNITKGLSGLSGETIAGNFGQLVNTLWIVSTKHTLFLGANLTEQHEHADLDFPLRNITVTSQGITTNQYVVSLGWVLVLFISSIILLAASTAAAYFEYRTIGPDFLGFANTAIRKGVKLPKSMNTLSARDRLQALQECEILLQDVRPDAEMGKIALGVKEESSVRLVHGRPYR